MNKQNKSSSNIEVKCAKNTLLALVLFTYNESICVIYGELCYFYSMWNDIENLLLFILVTFF